MGEVIGPSPQHPAQRHHGLRHRLGARRQRPALLGDGAGQLSARPHPEVRAALAASLEGWRRAALSFETPVIAARARR